MITLANGPYLSDSFTYTAAASTVPPTGNITDAQVPASAGGAGGNTALEPDPTNLQVSFHHFFHLLHLKREEERALIVWVRVGVDGECCDWEKG